MLAVHLERHLRSWQGPDPLKPLGLATGRTMEPLYRTLVERLLSWSADELEALRARWCSFNLDEYLGLSADDPRGYRAYMTHHLAAPLGFDRYSFQQQKKPPGFGFFPKPFSH